MTARVYNPEAAGHKEKSKVWGWQINKICLEYELNSYKTASSFHYTIGNEIRKF